jgi:hypothetical protein
LWNYPIEEMRCPGNEARMEGKKNGYKILVGKPKGRRRVRRHMLR